PMVATATVLGGHVRVGLEDNLYIARGELASGNAQLVERAVKIIELIGDTVATPAEAREIFGISGAGSASKAAE
ncbi:MAG: 3-keto-5-aminohexanoate cleavage protein, partial [Alphaproteobacteria bacterium]|nr:3-keto-5-aminohexanoate cleavage protein [Alphaproteobacteria bacterium]